MMNQHICRWLCVLTLFLLAILVPLPGQAQDGGLRETFDDPTLPGWELSPEVGVSEGVLRVGANGFAFRGARWSDLTLTIRARRMGDGVLTIQYRATDTGSYVFSFGNEYAALRREEARVLTDVAMTPLATPEAQWVEIDITVAGDVHTITLDGATVISVTDHADLPPGGVILRAEGGASGEFDDLVLTVSGVAAQITPAPVVSQVAGVPAYQAGRWERTGGPIGGLGYDIRYSFADPTRWYVTDAWAGFFISTDDGATWTPSNTGITARKQVDGIPVFSVTVDPHDPNILWLGTDITADIYKSTDAGATWVEMTNGIDPNLQPMSFRGFTVDPRTSDIVYAMAEIGSPAWTPDRSARKGLETDQTQGAVFKTVDGGQHWTQIWRGDNLARYCWIDPRNPDVLYVSTGIFDREAANTDVAGGFAGGVGILKSTDGGQTWRALDQDNGLLDLFIGSLYMHPQNPDVLLAAAGQNNWSWHGAQFTAGVYLTEDGGKHWQRVIADQEIFSTVEYCVSDPNVAYAGSSRAIYRSDDGGHTWQRFTRADQTWGSPGIVAGFPIDMQCDPRDPLRIFINNYLGGNFLSTDGGQTWVLSSEGYTGGLVNQVVTVPHHPGTVWAASRSGIYRSDQYGQNWRGMVYPPPEMRVKFNEIVTVAVDPQDPQHVLVVPTDYHGVMISTDGGLSWQMGAQFEPNQVAFALSDPSVVYAAANAGFFASRDGGVTWNPVEHELVSGRPLTMLVIHPTDANTVYVSGPGLGILKTADGGQTWQELTNGLPPASALSMAIDPARPDTLFAGLQSGGERIGGAGVYRSTDAGQTWSQMTAGLPPEGTFLSMVVDPTDGQIVYAADNFSGVYVSKDGGTTWNTLNAGLDHREVRSLAISDDGRMLYAGTTGGGVYRLGMP